MRKINYGAEERFLTKLLTERLSDDFEIFLEPEIQRNPGKFLVGENEFVTVPDIIIKPKKHLIDYGYFIDTIIPIEVKKFYYLEMNKYEDLMCQCHSYRFSHYNDQYPKLCLYFIDNFFETNDMHDHLQYDFQLSKDMSTPDFQIRNYVRDKNRIETLFGRLGIGEIIMHANGYIFRLKRQMLFKKEDDKYLFNPHILNFWRGSNRNSKAI